MKHVIKSLPIYFLFYAISFALAYTNRLALPYRIAEKDLIVSLIHSGFIFLIIIIAVSALLRHIAVVNWVNPLSGWRKFFSFIGVATLVPLIILFIAPSVTMHDAPQFLQVYIKYISNMSMLLLWISIMCWLYIWTVNTIKRNSLVINHKGRIYFPGSTFFQFPLYRRRLEAYSSVLQFYSISHKIKCADGEYTLEIIPAIDLLLSEAEERKISAFDWKAVREDLEETVKKSFLQEESDSSGKVLEKVKAHLIGYRSEVGFPKVWTDKTSCALKCA